MTSLYLVLMTGIRLDLRVVMASYSAEGGNFNLLDPLEDKK